MKKILLCTALLFLFCSCEISHNGVPGHVMNGTLESNNAPTVIEISFTNTPAPTEAPAEIIPEPQTETQTASEPTPSPSPTPTQTPTAAPTPEPVDTTREEQLVFNGDLPDEIEDPYPDNFLNSYGPDNLPNDSISWSFRRNNNHQPPASYSAFDIRHYDAHYLGDIEKKVVYLTFDPGYEWMGLTGTILDVLKEKEVGAAFFMTKPFIRDNPALAQRIAEEGHVAANHTVRHLNMPEQTDEEIEYEITETARYFEEVTGREMSPYFRPPGGVYSVRTLALTQKLGYKTFFWSFAYEDWNRDNQPGKEAAFNWVMNNLHNGMLILLHPQSSSNAEALPDIIDAIREQGFEFGSLDDFK